MMPEARYTVRKLVRLLPEWFNDGVETYEDVEPGMPKGQSDPVKHDDHIAEMVDLERAWWKLMWARKLNHYELLWSFFGEGETLEKLARIHGGTQSDLVLKMREDIKLIVDTMNGK